MSNYRFMRVRPIVLASALVLLLPVFAAAQAVTAQFIATDVFDPMGFMGGDFVGEFTDFGKLSCPSGQPTGVLDQPCSPGSRIHLRGIGWKSRLESEDPLLTGNSFVEGNFNLDANAAGSMVGTFRIELDDGGVWEGSWTGDKSKVKNVEAWVLRIRGVGHGKGGSVDGMQLRYTEVATIYTPLGFFWIGTTEGQILIPASR
jgi:hypothetical protein